MPAPGPKLVDFANPGEGAASGAALTAAVVAAQTTPEGRARVSLVFALLNVAPVAPGVPEPAPNNAEAIEAAQYASAVESFPLPTHPVRPVLDRARGRGQRILDAR